MKAFARGDSYCIIGKVLRSRHCYSVPSQLKRGGIINKVYLCANGNKFAPISVTSNEGGWPWVGGGEGGGGDKRDFSIGSNTF